MTENSEPNNETFDRLLADYIELLESKDTSRADELLREHPELADSIRAFALADEKLKGMMGEPVAMNSSFDEPTIDSGLGSTSQPEVIQTKIGYFGDYELLEEIARGGMGVVYKARQVNLNRIVALKMILAGQLASESDVRRFYQEAEAAASLNHPGIVPIYEVGQHEGQHFFSMGFVDGISLAHRLIEGPLPAVEATKLLHQVTDAVAYAHSRGVVHRDLKPANILLDENQQALVTDFGLAKKMESDDALTTTGQILGTPSYMAPEQATGASDEVGPLADVYSLGAVFYCMLTGRALFQSASVLETLTQVRQQEPVAPRQLNPQIPRDLETICLKCLEKDREARYDSAQSLTDDLARYLNGEPIVARPANSAERVVKWVRRYPVVSGLIATIVVVMIGGSLISTWFGIQSQRASIAESKARQAAELLADEKAALALAEQLANRELRRLNTGLTLQNAETQMQQGRVLDGLFSLAGAIDGTNTELQEVVRSNLAMWKSNQPSLEAAWQNEAQITSIGFGQHTDQVLMFLDRDGSPAGEFRDCDFRQQVTNTLPSRSNRLGKALDGDEKLTAALWLPTQTKFIAATSAGKLHRVRTESSGLSDATLQLKQDNGRDFQSSINQLVLSPDGKTLLAASREKRSAWLVDVETLQPRGEVLTTKGWISTLAFSHDSQLALIGTGGGEGFMNRGEAVRPSRNFIISRIDTFDIGSTTTQGNF